VTFVLRVLYFVPGALFSVLERIRTGSEATDALFEFALSQAHIGRFAPRSDSLNDRPQKTKDKAPSTKYKTRSTKY
jgi:hypothetical protein